MTKHSYICFSNNLSNSIRFLIFNFTITKGALYDIIKNEDGGIYNCLDISIYPNATNNTENIRVIF